MAPVAPVVFLRTGRTKRFEKLRVLIAATKKSSVTIQGNISVYVIAISKWISMTCAFVFVETELADFPERLALLSGT